MEVVVMKLEARNPHAIIDERLLALHVAVCREFLRRPSSVRELATENIQRWLANGVESLPLREWQEILSSSSDEELAALLVDEGEEASELRQSTPFTGIISDEERLVIMRRYARG